MSMAFLFFLLIFVLGLVGNLKAYKNDAFKGWNIWFWNIIWVMALKVTWVGIPG